MGLSFKEKRGLQKIVDAKRDELQSSNLPFREKRAAQKALQDAFTKLKEKIDIGGEAIENEKLKALVAGDYNDKPVPEFLVIMDEIVTEIGAFEPVKQPAIAYVNANKDKMRESE